MSIAFGAALRWSFAGECGLPLLHECPPALLDILACGAVVDESLAQIHIPLALFLQQFVHDEIGRLQ